MINIEDLLINIQIKKVCEKVGLKLSYYGMKLSGVNNK